MITTWKLLSSKVYHGLNNALGICEHGKHYQVLPTQMVPISALAHGLSVHLPINLIHSYFSCLLRIRIRERLRWYSLFICADEDIVQFCNKMNNDNAYAPSHTHPHTHQHTHTHMRENMRNRNPDLLCVVCVYYASIIFIRFPFCCILVILFSFGRGHGFHPYPPG